MSAGPKPSIHCVMNISLWIPSPRDVVHCTLYLTDVVMVIPAWGIIGKTRAMLRCAPMPWWPRQAVQTLTAQRCLRPPSRRAAAERPFMPTTDITALCDAPLALPGNPFRNRDLEPADVQGAMSVRAVPHPDGQFRPRETDANQTRCKPAPP
jgi:hypothetical protein